jgi:transcription antitermination factor NusG
MQLARIAMFPDDPRYRAPRGLRKGAWPSPTPTREPGDTWFVLWVDGAKEIEIEGELKEMAIEVFLPVSVEKRDIHPRFRRKGRPHFSLIRRPLFPNYIFVCLPTKSTTPWHAVLSVKGVREVMSNDGHAIPIRPEPIEALRKAVEEGDFDAAVIEAERLAALVGQLVTIRKGAFAGHAATVVEASPKSVTAEIEILGRKTRLKLARKEIET